MRRYRRNPNTVFQQIAVNTAQDVVVIGLSAAVIGGVIYLIYKKSQEAGQGVGQDISNFLSSTSASLFPGAGAQSAGGGATVEQGAGASVAAGTASTSATPNA